MKKFTKEEMENDLRCYVANTFDLLIANFEITNKDGKMYVSRPGDHNSPLIILEDGKNAEAIIRFLDVEDGQVWVSYTITKDEIFQSVPHMYPVNCTVDEVRHDLQEYAIYFM
jgi:hypothetical protein